MKGPNFSDRPMSYEEAVRVLQVPPVPENIRGVNFADIPDNPLTVSVQFMRAAVRLGFNLAVRPGRAEGTQTVLTDNHISQHKLFELQHGFLTYDSLAQPLRFALDAPRPMVFSNLWEGKRPPPHTLVDSPKPDLDTRTAKRFFMTAFKRARQLEAGGGFGPLTAPDRPTDGERAAARIIHGVLEAEIKPFNVEEINEMILGGLNRVLDQRAGLSPYRMPHNAEDIVALSGANPYYLDCEPCQNIAGKPISDLDRMRAEAWNIPPRP